MPDLNSIYLQLDRFADSVQFIGCLKNEHCTVTYHELSEPVDNADSTWCVMIYNNIKRTKLAFIVSFNEFAKVIYISEVDSQDTSKITNVQFDITMFNTSGSVPDKVICELQNTALSKYAHILQNVL